MHNYLTCTFDYGNPAFRRRDYKIVRHRAGAAGLTEANVQVLNYLNNNSNRAISPIPKIKVISCQNDFFASVCL